MTEPKAISLWHVTKKAMLQGITAHLVKNEVWFDFRIIEKGKRWVLIFRDDYKLPAALAKGLEQPVSNHPKEKLK